MSISIGVDVGNYDTKSAHTTIPGGYTVSSVALPSSDEYIYYNGSYYYPSENRFPYRMDKTSDERAKIFTMFGIAKEILSKPRPGKSPAETAAGVREINLGVGLPPAHFATLKDKTHDYYIKEMGSGISFTYNDIQFSFKINNVYVFPQDWTAVAMNARSYQLIQDYIGGVVYAIDIGGMTVDYIPIIKGKPDMSNADSIEKGINKMYDSICTMVMRTTGHPITAFNIEQVLNDKNSVLPEQTKNLIKEETGNWAKKIIDDLRAKGMDLWANPGIFLGGGSLLLKNYLKRDGLLEHSIFIESANVNAKAYTAAVVNIVRSTS